MSANETALRAVMEAKLPTRSRRKSFAEARWAFKNNKPTVKPVDCLIPRLRYPLGWNLAHLKETATPRKKRFARKMRENPSPGETAMWNVLRRLTVQFERQFVMFGYIADFYCPNYGLVIEIDGKQHLAPEQAAWDVQRNQVMNRAGITVLRFPVPAILRDPQGVLNAIRETMERLFWERTNFDRGVQTETLLFSNDLTKRENPAESRVTAGSISRRASGSGCPEGAESKPPRKQAGE